MGAFDGCSSFGCFSNSPLRANSSGAENEIESVGGFMI